MPTATTAHSKTRKKALLPQEEAHIVYKDPARQAQMAGLRYATDQGPGLTRKATRTGKFSYYMTGSYLHDTRGIEPPTSGPSPDHDKEPRPAYGDQLNAS